MTLPATLSVGPYRFPLYARHPSGPWLDAEDYPAEALACAINSICSGRPPEFREALERGGDASVSGGFIRSPSSPEEAQEMLRAWIDAGGEAAPPESMVRVGFPFLYERAFVPRAVLARAVAELNAVRASWTPPAPPWLFTRNAPLNTPHPSEQATVLALEARAADIDRRAAAQNGKPEPAELIADRRALLVALGDAGFYEVDLSKARAHTFHEWGCEALDRWHEAVQAMRVYHGSEERQERLPGPPPTSPLDARVCLDLFRGGLSGVSSSERMELASLGEAALRARDLPKGDQGTLFIRGAEGWMTLLWRADREDVACLLAIAPRPT